MSANASRAAPGGPMAGVTVDLAKTGLQDTGGAGVDTISGVEYLSGSNFDDRLSGTEDFNEILGLGGADRLEGRGGNDSLIGGDDISATMGPDTVSYADPSPGVGTGVKLDLNVQGAAQDTGSEGHDYLAGIGNVIASPYADVITGGAQANRLDAGSGADTVSAGDGPDALLLRDGIGDTADCGGADDSVESDAAGLDVLTGCEQVAFAPTPPAATTNQAAGGSTTGGSDTTLTFRYAAASLQRLGRRGTVRCRSCAPPSRAGDACPARS
jgi:Ca2+-binding RTX toxin-like protein